MTGNVVPGTVEVRVPIGTKVVFVERQEHIVTDVASVLVHRRPGKRSSLLVADTRSIEELGFSQHTTVHPEHGEAI